MARKKFSRTAHYSKRSLGAMKAARTRKINKQLASYTEEHYGGGNWLEWNRQRSIVVARNNDRILLEIELDQQAGKLYREWLQVQREYFAFFMQPHKGKRPKATAHQIDVAAHYRWYLSDDHRADYRDLGVSPYGGYGERGAGTARGKWVKDGLMIDWRKLHPGYAS